MRSCVSRAAQELMRRSAPAWLAMKSTASMAAPSSSRTMRAYSARSAMVRSTQAALAVVNCAAAGLSRQRLHQRARLRRLRGGRRIEAERPGDLGGGLTARAGIERAQTRTRR